MKLFLLLFILLIPVATAKVVVIGMDGLGGKYITEDNAPFVTSLFKQGTYCTNVQSVLPAISASNWYSAFSGVSSKQHGVISDTKNSEYPHKTIFEKYDSSLYYTATVKPAIENHIMKGTWSLTDQGTLNKARTSQLTFVHFDYIDIYGHLFGYNSKLYNWMVKKVDKKVKTFVEKLPKETTILIMSDHGGLRKSHKEDTPEERTAFMVMVGEGIKQNNQIKEMQIYEITPMIEKALQGPTKKNIWKEGSFLHFLWERFS